MTSAAAAVAPFLSTTPSPAAMEAALEGSGSLSARTAGGVEGGLLRRYATLTRHHPRPHHSPFTTAHVEQLLLPLPTHALNPKRVEDPKEARALGERLGNAKHYLQRTLTSEELPSMTVIRTLARLVLETETAQLLNEESRSSFLEGLQSVNGETRVASRRQVVNEAKLLVLRSVLRYEDSELLGRYPTLVNSPNVQALFKNLASLLVGLDRFTLRYETSDDRAQLKKLVGLEKTFEALGAFLPWAKALFPAELQALETRLAQRDLKLKDLITRGQERVRIARGRLYRIENSLPPLTVLRLEPKAS